MNLKQLIFGIFNIKNTVIQNNYENNYKNENLLSEGMEKIFIEIDELFEDERYDIVEEKINNIYRKKQDRLSDNLQKQLLKYSCFLALRKKDDNKLKECLQELESYGEYTEESIQVKFNIAIFNKDRDLFKKIKDYWESNKYESEKIEENEANFLYLTEEYDELIGKFNKDKFLNNPKIKIYIAKALSKIGRLEEANKLSLDIKDISGNFKIEYIVQKLLPLLDKPRYLGEASEYEKNIFNNCLEEIDMIDMDKLCNRDLKILLYYKLQVLIYVSKEKALEEMNDIPKDIADSIEFTVLKICIFNINNKAEEADKLCNYMLNDEMDNTNYIEIIMNIKLIIKKFDEIIEIYNKYKTILVGNQHCFFIYGLSLINLYGEEDTLKIISRENKVEGDLINLLFAKANIRNVDKCKEYLNKCVSNIDKEDLLILDIIHVYEEISEYSDAINVLKPSCEYNIMFFKKYISLIINNNIHDKIGDIVKIYEKYYFNINNHYIDSNLYKICIEQKNYRYAYYISNKLFNYKRDIYWTNEYMRMKLLNEDYSDLDKNITILESEEKPGYIITAGEAYLKLGDFRKSEELIYKTMYNLEVLDLNFAMRIWNILLKSRRAEQEEIVNKDNIKVMLDDIIILEDNLGKELKICLNREYFYRKNKERFGCVHIDDTNCLWGELLGRKINDTIVYNSFTYRITEIVNKIDYIGRECFKVVCSSNVNQIKNIQIKNDEDDLDLEALKKELIKINKKHESVIQAYVNKKHRFGVPINIITNETKKIEYTIDYLFSNRENRFVTGFPNIVVKGKKVVLTVVATLFLNKYDVLEDFMKFYDVYIPKSMIQMIEDIINDSINNFYNREASIYLIEDTIVADEKDEREKKLLIDKYRKIKNVLMRGNIVSEDIFKSKLLDISKEFLYTADIEAFEIARKINGIVFIEDRCTAMLHFYSENYRGSRSNISGFINSILYQDFKKFWKILKDMLKGKYEYVFNYGTLACLVIDFKTDKVGDYKKFRSIIRFIIENDLDNVYKESLIMVCRQAISFNQHMLIAKKIEIIIEEINHYK